MPDNIIKQLADKLGSQKEAARALGVSQAAVSRWIHGAKIPDVASNLAYCILEMMEE